MTEDIDRLNDWKKNGNTNALAELMIKYQPLVHSVVNKYKTVGVSPPALRAKANAQLISAFKTYDPKFNTVLSTHIYNNLQKVQRMARESIQSGHIPEYRNLKLSTFVTARDNLTDRLGYEPNVKQMSDELKWSQKEVGRMNSELGKEVSYSSMSYDSFGGVDPSDAKDRDLLDYLYHEVSDKDKLVIEYLYGMGGKPKLNNKEIAAKLKTNEMDIHRRRIFLGNKIRDFR